MKDEIDRLRTNLKNRDDEYEAMADDFRATCEQLDRLRAENAQLVAELQRISRALKANEQRTELLNSK